MRIGILGTRGIPNAYGGFEQCAQYLALGLSRRGHEVWVYNSSDHPYREPEWNGVHIVHCRDWEKKIGTAGQFLYDLNCFRDAASRNYDILLQLGYTSSSVWYRLWPAKAINVVNMDGLEWKRSKYSQLTQKFLRRAERWAANHGDILIADSIGIREHLNREYGRPSIYIPYGAEIPVDFAEQVPKEFLLEPRHYFLLMARMEPENNIEMVIQGWLSSPKDRPLVMIGNTRNGFGQYLARTYRDDRLHFLGAIYDGVVVNALRHFSSLYLHGHSVGGTNPSLLEAMACGCLIAAHDNPFNKAILGADARFFSTARQVTEILVDPPTRKTADKWKFDNQLKVRTCYNWEVIIDDYEKVFETALKDRLLTP